MRPTHLDGIVFSEAEMLALMNVVRPEDLIAIDLDALIPADKEAHEALIRTGLQQLIQRDLMSVEGDIHVLDPELLMMIQVVAFPTIVNILIKDVPEIGQQQFTYYQADQLVVEHTMPAQDQYRFAVLPDVRALMERMAFILPAQQEASRPHFAFNLPQDGYFQVRELVLAGDLTAADLTLRSLGLAPEAAQTLLHAMADPRFSGTIAYLATEPPRVVNARNLAVLQGQDSAWTMRPSTPSSLHLRTETEDTLLERLYEGWRDLVTSSGN